MEELSAVPIEKRRLNQYRNCQMKKTKNCIYPWSQACFFGDGTVLPCCGDTGKVPGFYGNLKRDFLYAKPEDKNIFKNSNYKKLRKDLLTGNVPDFCKSCRIVEEDDIDIKDFQQRVRQHLHLNNKAIDATNLSDDDLLTNFSIKEVLLSINNKCNLRCVYCPQSIPKKRKGSEYDLFSTIDFYKAELSEGEFFEILELLVPFGLEVINFVGIAELTIYKHWKSLAKKLKSRYPHLRLCVVTNFSLPYSEEDISSFMMFDLVNISIDTLDKDILEKVRVGANLDTILKNIENLIKSKGNASKPTISFNVTEYDLMIEHLPDLGRFAAQNGIHINFSNLFTAEGTVADKTQCLKSIVQMSDTVMPKVWETINSLPRRMKAENPKIDIHHLGPMYDIIRERAEKISPNYFVPSVKEETLTTIHNKFVQGSKIYLRDIYLRFDQSYRGVYMPRNKNLCISEQDCKTLIITPILVEERDDQNLNINVCESLKCNIEDRLRLNTCHIKQPFTHVLFDIKDTAFQKNLAPVEHISLKNFKPLSDGQFIRENLLPQQIDRLIDKVAKKYKEVFLWGAGARSEFLLKVPATSKLNIAGIIDTDSKRWGQIFHGLEVISPDQAENAQVILICNVISPEKIERSIKSSNLYDVPTYIV